NSEFYAQNPKMLDLQAFQPHLSVIIYSSSLMWLGPTDDVCLRDLAIKTIFNFLAGTEGLELITSSNANFWLHVWTEIQTRKPELGKLKVKHDEVDKRNYGVGVGFVEDGERLDQILQLLGLKPGTWAVAE